MGRSVSGELAVILCAARTPADGTERAQPSPAPPRIPNPAPAAPRTHLRR